MTKRLTLDSRLRGLSMLLGGLQAAIEATRGRQPTCWQDSIAQVLARKVFFHSATAYSLADRKTQSPTEIRPEPFLDHASIGVCARAAFEASMVFQSLLVQGTPEERDFRHACWRLAGELHWLRSEDKKQKGAWQTAELMTAKAEHQREADLWKHKVESSPLFSQIKKDKKRDDVLQGREWKMASWSAIAKEASIDSGLASLLYGDLCEIAHSGQAGIQAFDLAQDDDSRERLLGFPFQALEVAIALILRDYPKLSTEVDVAIAGHQAASRASVLLTFTSWSIEFLNQAIEGIPDDSDQE